MTRTKFKRVALYTRVSKDRTGEAESPELHIAEARRWAEAMGHIVVGEYIDRNVSGYKVTMASREHWKRLCQDVEAGKIDAVCVQRLDRFSRRFREALETIEWLKGHEVGFLCASEQIDTSTPLGEALAGLMFAIGEQFIVSLSANIARTWEAHAAQGKPHVTAQRCYGYTKDYEQIPAEAKIVRQVVKDITGGKSLNAVSVDLNRRGITTSTGRRWSRTSVLQTFTRAALAGLREHTTEEDRKLKRPGTITQGTWSGIISPEQRDALIVRLSTLRGSTTGTVVSSVPTSLLTGVVRCGSCGSKMAKRLDRYTCSTGRSDTKACGKVAAMIARVDEIVIEALTEHVTALTIPKWAARRLDPVSIRAEIARLESDLAEATRARYVTKTIKTDKEYAVVRDELTSELERRRTQLTEAETETQSGIPFGAGRDAVEAWWLSADLADRRLAVRDVFESVTVAPAVKGGCRFEVDRVTWELQGGPGRLFATGAEADAAAG